MVNAQEWLNNKYPREERAEIRGLLIKSAEYQNEDVDEFPLFQIDSIPQENRNYLDTSLTGELNLTDFVNLEKLIINDQHVTKLIINNCANLSILDCSNNYLENLDLTNLSQLKIFSCSSNQIVDLDLSPLASEKLENIWIDNNNLSERNLSCFSRFVNLKNLHLENDDEEMIRQGKYNRFHGSLEFLSNLEELETLNISGTDINSGLEHSPPNLKFFFCAKIRSGARVEEIRNRLGLDERQAQSKEEDVNWATSILVRSFRDLRILKEQIQARVGNEIEPLLSEFLETQKVVKAMGMFGEAANNTGISLHTQESPMVVSYLLRLMSLKQELLRRQVIELEINELCELQSSAIDAKILLMANRQSTELLQQQSQIIQVNPWFIL